MTLGALEIGGIPLTLLDSWSIDDGTPPFVLVDAPIDLPVGYSDVTSILNLGYGLKFLQPVKALVISEIQILYDATPDKSLLTDPEKTLLSNLGILKKEHASLFTESLALDPDSEMERRNEREEKLQLYVRYLRNAVHPTDFASVMNALLTDDLERKFFHFEVSSEILAFTESTGAYIGAGLESLIVNPISELPSEVAEACAKILRGET